MRGAALDAVTRDHLCQPWRLSSWLSIGIASVSVIAKLQCDEVVWSASSNLVLWSGALRAAEVDRVLLTGVGAAVSKFLDRDCGVTARGQPVGTRC